MIAALALIPVAYLVGTFPTAHLVAKSRGIDITKEGSGNPGASNVRRLLGRGPAAIVFAGDIAKGAVPAAAGLVLWDHAGAYVLGTSAVLGHVYPATRRFRGGRGVATAAGLIGVVYPLVSLALLVVFVVVLRATHKASVGSITIALLLPVLVWLTDGEIWELAATGAISVLVVARHSANLRRLIHGEELRLDLEDPQRSNASREAPRRAASE